MDRVLSLLKVRGSKTTSPILDGKGREVGTVKDLIKWLTGRAPNTWFNCKAVAASAIQSPGTDEKEKAKRIREYTDEMLACASKEEIRPLDETLAWALSSMRTLKGGNGST
jgi:hypothetical protein